MNYLITGGCGFIGCNFIRRLFAEDAGVSVTNIDKLTYAGSESNLADVAATAGDRYRLIRADIGDAAAVEEIIAGGKFDILINFAAESHVDRSITSPADFVSANIVGTANLLQSARQHGIPRYVQISTDEVYGSLGETGYFTETTPLAPSSPYSASKAAADLLALAAFHTYGQDIVITRCSNNYGPYQFPEKLIPLMITRALAGEKLPVYGDGQNVRDWIHVDDHCAGIAIAADRGKAGEVYNFGGNNEHKNLDLVRAMLQSLGKSEDLIEFVTDRPGHDRRYAIDASKARNELGWIPTWNFEAGLQQTVDWYVSRA